MHDQLDTFYMQQALTCAQHGIFTVKENPRVGCLLVKDNAIVATGYHSVLGQAHAEADALQKASSSAQGCTAYVTLEPCAHFGKTPPCSDALVTAGITRVVTCNDDPNPIVGGRGYDTLRAAGIPFTGGILHEHGTELNQGFFHRMQTGKPWVRLKQAQSLDGRTAMKNGESFWITGAQSRADVQYWRGRSQAILTGIETVLADDCQLTVRADELPAAYKQLPHNFSRQQPLRVVLDTRLRIPVTAKIIADDGCCVVFTRSTDTTKIQRLRDLGVTVIQQALIDSDSAQHPSIDLTAVIDWLGDQRINEVLCECGATLAGQLWQSQLIDEWLLYVAPVIMGSSARATLNIDIQHMQQRLHMGIHSMESIGDDWRIRARPQLRTSDNQQ